MKLSFPATLLLSVASVSAQQSSVQVPNSHTDEVQGYKWCKGVPMKYRLPEAASFAS
jgi:hypothetical protein